MENEEMESMWLGMTCDGEKPERIIFDGITWHLVPERWKEEVWDEEHYEPVENSD